MAVALLTLEQLSFGLLVAFETTNSWLMLPWEVRLLEPVDRSMKMLWRRAMMAGIRGAITVADHRAGEVAQVEGVDWRTWTATPIRFPSGSLLPGRSGMIVDPAGGYFAKPPT